MYVLTITRGKYGFWYVILKKMIIVLHFRIAEYKHMPNQPESALLSKGTVIFREYSTDVGEPYYPVPNPANQELYQKYQKLSLQEKNVLFVGRLASYKYFNMDQAILAALEMYDDILEKEIVKLSNEEKSQVEWRLEIKAIENLLLMSQFFIIVVFY